MPEVFKELQAKNIPFAVFVYTEQMKIKGMEASTRGYYVAILKRDKKEMKGFRFKQAEEYLRTVVHYELNEDEAEYFKNNVESFVKVMHNGEGRVYELKGTSRTFREAHEDFRKKIEA